MSVSLEYNLEALLNHADSFKTLLPSHHSFWGRHKLLHFSSVNFLTQCMQF